MPKPWKMAGWALCAWLAAGIFQASLRAQSGRTGWYYAECRRAQSFAIGLSVGGPISLFAALVVSGFAVDGASWSCADAWARQQAWDRGRMGTGR